MRQNEIVCSNSASVRIEMALAWVTSRLNSSEVLVISSTRTAADEFARHISGPGSLGLHCLSLTLIVSELALLKSAEFGLAPLSRLGEEAIAARITHRLNSAQELAYFRPVAQFAGFPAALASTISELRLAGIAAETIVARTGALLDLRRLLRAFDEELDQRSLADQSRMLTLAHEMAGRGKHRLIALPTVLLDLPLASKAHVDFITALAGRSPAVMATAHQKDAVAINALEAALGVKSRIVLPASVESGLEHVRSHLFSIEQPPARAYDQSVDLLSAPGEGLEAVEMDLLQIGKRKSAVQWRWLDNSGITQRYRRVCG